MKDNNNLKGYDAINRAKQLMSESTNVESTIDRKGFSLVKKGADGNTYAIVKENSKYFLKKASGNSALTHSDFKYLMGDTKKSSVMFESFSKATNKLNNILIGLNEMHDTSCGVDNLLISDTKVREDIQEDQIMGDDLELQEEEAEYQFDVNEMISEENPLDEMENECMTKLDEMTDFLEDSINEKFTLKLDAPKTEETPDLDLGSIEDDSNSDIEDMGDEMGDETDMDNDNPFEDKPFDAGVEADEDEDPEKFLQQISGKLATSLRQYNDENEGDVDTQKFVANTVLSAVDTKGMDQSDIKDIKDKLESSSREDEEEGDDFTPKDDSEESFDNEDETPDDEMDELTEEETELFNNAWSSFKKKEVNEELDAEDNEKIIQSLRDSSPKRIPNSGKQYKEKEGQKKLTQKRKNMDPQKPLSDPINRINENYNKNLDEYLCSLVNPGIFVNDEKKNEMTEQPVVKPDVRPTITPSEAPSRRQAPFKRPGSNPQTQPKFKR